MKKLSKKTLQKSWWMWFTGNLSSMSFEWLEAFGFASSMAPVIKELYPDDKQKQIEALQNHSIFYNTEPQIGAVINGIACGLEEEKANGGAVDAETINGIKIGLMGPLAGIGDALVPGMYIPLLLSIAIGLSENGNIMGPLFYIITFLSTTTLLSYFLFLKGYTLGVKSIDLIIGEAAIRARESFNLLGTIVVGGVAASFVNFNVKWVIPTGGETSVVVNDVLNGIFPKIMPLLLVIFCWYLMSKKQMSATKVMGVLILVAIVGVFIGAF